MRYAPPPVDRIRRQGKAKNRPRGPSRNVVSDLRIGLPRNRRKPNLKALFCLFVVSAAISGAVAFALQTPMLLVRQVKIKGVRLADRRAVENAARAALGRNIILLRTSPIARGIRELPEVATVKLGRSFPDGIWVRVWERKPEAVVTSARTCCMVQGDCLAFHRTDGPVRGVPVVCVARGFRIREGERCSSADVANALQVLKCARKCELSVAKISVDPLGDMCLNMGGGFYVKLGQPDDIAQKMSVLRTALTYRPSLAREAAYIDLSCPSAPVWRPKSASGAAT